MAHFVKQHKQHISGYEFGESQTIFWRKALVPLITGVRACGGVDPGLKLLSFGRSGLREDRLGREHEDERQKQQNMPRLEEARLHGAASRCYDFVAFPLYFRAEAPASQPYIPAHTHRRSPRSLFRLKAFMLYLRFLLCHSKPRYVCGGPAVGDA
jgi:hypothetical protein